MQEGGVGVDRVINGSINISVLHGKATTGSNYIDLKRTDIGCVTMKK